MHECTRAHTNTHGCTITRPTYAAILKAHSPSWYLVLHMHARTHISRTHAHIACFPPKHSQYANPAWKLERRRRGASFASTGHVPWQPHPDCQPVRWDMCGTLTQWQRSYWSSDLIKKGGTCILALSGTPRASFIYKQPYRHRVILHYWSCDTVTSAVCWSFSPQTLTGYDRDQQSQIRTKNLWG